MSGPGQATAAPLPRPLPEPGRVEDRGMTQALLLMDLQNGILDRFPDPGTYLDRVVASEAPAQRGWQNRRALAAR